MMSNSKGMHASQCLHQSCSSTPHSCCWVCTADNKATANIDAFCAFYDVSKAQSHSETRTRSRNPAHTHWFKNENRSVARQRAMVTATTRPLRTQHLFTSCRGVLREICTCECVTKTLCVATCLTYHGRFNETPGVALRHVGLEDARRPPGLVHTSEHVDLPSAHRGRGRVDRLGERRNRLPLVGDRVVPEQKEFWFGLIAALI